MFYATTDTVDACDLPVNTDADRPDRGHAQRVLDSRGLRLVDVLSCCEECDGAVYSVLARDPGGNLLRVSVCSEPGYAYCEVETAL